MNKIRDIFPIQQFCTTSKGRYVLLLRHEQSPNARGITQIYNNLKGLKAIGDTAINTVTAKGRLQRKRQPCRRGPFRPKKGEYEGVSSNPEVSPGSWPERPDPCETTAESLRLNGLQRSKNEPAIDWIAGSFECELHLLKPQKNGPEPYECKAPGLFQSEHTPVTRTVPDPYGKSDRN